MQLILAGKIHIPQIKNLLDRNFNEVLSKTHSPEIINKFKLELSVENLTSQLSWKKVYVMIEDGNVVGTGSFANFGTVEQPKWSVSNLYVLPEEHIKRIGSYIIKQLIQDAQQESAKTLHVPSSRNAVGFYQKIGFVVDSLQPDVADEITWMTLII